MSSKNLCREESLQHDQEEFENFLVSAISKNSLMEAKKIIAKAHIADFAGFFNKATTSQKEITLKLLDEKQLIGIIVELDASVIPVVVEMLGVLKIAKIINLLDFDDVIYVLDCLENEIRRAILNNVNKNKKKEITEGFSYPENSAGRLMQKEFISVPENWTIGQVIEYMQDKQETMEILHEIFVTNSKLIPIGSVSLATLAIKEKSFIIKDVMNSKIISVKTDLEEKEVSYLFKKYGFVTVPVVNKYNRMLGVITLADVFEVNDKNAEENMMHMVGVREDDVYLDIIEVVRSRFPWLLVSLLATIICSVVVNYFHDTIQQAVILSAIMPIIAGISGNAGTQTMTVTVLSIASKEITALNILRVIRNQIISCSCNGVVLAILGGAILALLHHNYALSYVFGLAVIINFALAGFFGAIIPIVLDKLGFDPAVSSSVFVTTLTDVLSFGIFLSLASQFLI